MIVLTILCYAILGVYELVPLYKQHQFRELWLNFVIGTGSFTIAILISLGVQIPSPAEPIKQVVFSLIGSR